MKSDRTYLGRRTPTGARVTVNGAQLNPRFDLRQHSPEGFEWGYFGSGPCQLGLALSADATEDDVRALQLYFDFTRRVIVTLKADSWHMTASYVLDVLEELANEMRQRREGDPA